MILKALCEYYDQIRTEHPGDVPMPGWCERRVSFVVNLDEDGTVIGVLPYEGEKGKLGKTRRVPYCGIRTSTQVKPYLLCDNPSYMLGTSAKDTPERSRTCFEKAAAEHLGLLSGVDTTAAQGLCRFFESWDPDCAVEAIEAVSNPDVAAGLLKAANVEFACLGELLLDDEAVCAAWQARQAACSDSAGTGICLVTGEYGSIARIHPCVKGVYGGEASGGSLVGFNQDSFRSYGHDQGDNAPVSPSAAFAYATALNYLLGRERHRMLLGDTTVVYWAARDDDRCCDLFNASMGGSLGGGSSADVNVDKYLDEVFRRVRSGKPVDGLDLDAEFFILGLAPSKKRLSVRFFHHSTFGSLLRNIAAHYDRIEVAKGPNERRYIPMWKLLQEIEPPSGSKPKSDGARKKTSALSAAFLRSILENSPYPEEIYSRVLHRVLATQDNADKRSYKVTRGKAALIKAYMLANRKMDEEVVSVQLNAERSDLPYLLGRTFSVMEDIQHCANPKIKATIKNGYYNSASTTPATVFPTLIRKTEMSLASVRRKMPGAAVNLDKQLTSLLNDVAEAAAAVGTQAFPTRLDMVEQGSFYLGYYQQRHASFEAKAAAKTGKEGKEETDTQEAQED